MPCQVVVLLIPKTTCYCFGHSLHGNIPIILFVLDLYLEIMNSQFDFFSSSPSLPENGLELWRSCDTGRVPGELLYRWGHLSIAGRPWIDLLTRIEAIATSWWQSSVSSLGHWRADCRKHLANNFAGHQSPDSDGQKVARSFIGTGTLCSVQRAAQLLASAAALSLSTEIHGAGLLL